MERKPQIPKTVIIPFRLHQMLEKKAVAKNLPVEAFITKALWASLNSLIEEKD